MLRSSLALLVPLLTLAADPKFADGLYPVLTKANCKACHVDNGIASGTRLHFPEGDQSPAQIEAFGRSLSALVNRDQIEQSLLFVKPTNRIKHTGGKLIVPGSPQEAVLLDWIKYLAKLTPETVTSAATVE